MTSLIVPILILFAITSSYAQTTPDRKCMDCMCQVERYIQHLIETHIIVKILSFLLVRFI